MSFLRLCTLLPKYFSPCFRSTPSLTLCCHFIP
jgi:hypothetical protein